MGDAHADLLLVCKTMEVSARNSVLRFFLTERFTEVIANVSHRRRTVRPERSLDISYTGTLTVIYFYFIVCSYSVAKTRESSFCPCLAAGQKDTRNRKAGPKKLSENLVQVQRCFMAQPKPTSQPLAKGKRLT